MVTAWKKWLYMDVGDVAQRPLEIAMAHSKLALEHSKPVPMLTRREAIRNEITLLSVKRDALLNITSGQDRGI
ncbi:hypothetical protein J2Z22_004776 [Paenibacillus forsythiae]|uniref:Uncharacterized protein n=1 Tax=Paenibacillus forsythiae TaxID=365616 RepID=A0ABU3HEC6_9BACL|nr:hypothetical protein [Paenibacillus forsythiae]